MSNSPNLPEEWRPRRCMHIPAPSRARAGSTQTIRSVRSDSHDTHHKIKNWRAHSASPTTAFQQKTTGSLPTPAPSLSRSQLRFQETHDCPPTVAFSYMSREPLALRVPGGRVSRTAETACKWTRHFGQRHSAAETQDSADSLEWRSWAHERIVHTDEDHMDTSETYSTGSPELDHDHKFSPVVDELTRIAVDTFRSEHARSARKRSLSPLPQQNRKRSRLGADQVSVLAESFSDPEDSDAVLVEHPSKRPRVWPCPYFVKDRETHVSCLTRHCLLDMVDVREHLCLMHREPIYCAVCYETFPTVNLRDDHMRTLECLHQPPVIRGITGAQERELDEQGDTEKRALRTDPKQWLNIWQIVFPGTQPPASPFSFSQREFNVYRLRRFWKKNGQNIISDVLRRHRLQDYSIENEERNLEALYCLVANRAVDEVLLHSHV